MGSRQAPRHSQLLELESHHSFDRAASTCSPSRDRYYRFESRVRRSQRRLLGTLASGRESARTTEKHGTQWAVQTFQKYFSRYPDFGFLSRFDCRICAPCSQPSMTPSARLAVAFAIIDRRSARCSRCEEGRDGETATSGRTKKRPQDLVKPSIVRLWLFAANDNTISPPMGR
jgi:hypothetical protein